MEVLYWRLKDRPFQMPAVSIDQGGAGVVGPFRARLGLTLPVLLDPESSAYELCGLTGVPETFIVDKNGGIIQKIFGPHDWMSTRWLEYFNRMTGC